MSARILFTLLIIACQARGQQNAFPLFDARHWGVVLEHPAMKNVIAKKDVTFWKDEKSTLAMDVYMPPGLKAGEKRPAIIFLNGIGDGPAGQPSVRNWMIYSTWPQLVAAYGFIGISPGADGSRIQESFKFLFNYLKESGATFHIDSEQLGVYAASANTTEAGTYLMRDDAFKGIKAAVLYYGSAPPSPFRKDLPVLFFIAEGDVRRNGYSGVWTDVLKNNAPWTIKMGTGLPHGFDAFSDTPEGRRAVRETISFWKDQLEPIPTPSWPHELPREAVAASYMHDDNKATDLAKQWLTSHPDDKDALGMFAYAAKNARRYAEAEGAYRKLIGTETDDPFQQMEFAQVLYGVNKPEEADRYAAMAQQSGRIPRFQYVVTASILYYQKDYARCAAYYEKALALQSSSVDYYNLGCTYALGNEKDKAFACLTKAVELGAASKQQYMGDSDLASLHADARWKELMEKLK
ncbi:MAG: hypothetical protein JNL40_03375 [Cyclobacteriaceae bacterium]|nr:hypothetical protein [Cyclobacteriaceae bacterium]